MTNPVKDRSQWESEFRELMEMAEKLLRPEWECGETVVLKTVNNHIYTVEIPNYQDHTIREPLENRCVQTLAEQDDTQVLVCLATVNGKVPEIPSWNFRSRLIELNESNLQTETFLWGGGDKILLTPFSKLLPPNHTIKKGT